MISTLKKTGKNRAQAPEGRPTVNVDEKISVLEWGENQKDLDDAKTNLKEVETKLLEYEFILETFKQSVFRTSVTFISFILRIDRG